MKVDSERILTRAEIQTVVDHLRRKRRYMNNRMNLVIFRLSTCCGLRASEIAELTVDDIVLRPVKPYIRVRKGKGGKSRQVPLWWDADTLADLKAWVSERPARALLLCTRTGNKIDRQSIRRRYIQACKILGRKRITVHDGRHTFVSLALAGGRSLPAVRDAAGHSNVSVTNVYLHTGEDDGTVGDLFAA